MLQKAMPSVDTMVLLASLSLISMIFVVGCSGPEAQTLIIVQLPTDLSESKPVSVDDVLIVVRNTAAQFGLRETSHTSYSNWDSDEHPRIWLDVQHDIFPLVVEIREAHIEHRTLKHRNLADALVNNLNKYGLNAAVTYHTPDPVERGWFFYATISSALVAVVTRFLWRRSRLKRVVTV